MLVLAERWLPGAPVTAETLGTALWLETNHWERMELAVANGIARAFNGS